MSGARSVDRGASAPKASRAEQTDVAGPAGLLEALIDAPRERAQALALLCHPHPLHQGTMHNKVVSTLARSFSKLGAVAVRFNFRGVGRSQGEHSGAGGEVDDALSVARWMQREWAGLPLYLGGFSFGAAIALQAAATLDPRGLVTVAPSIARLGDRFVPPPCPWLVIQGNADDVTPAQALIDWLQHLERQPALVLLDGAGHFFHGRLGEIDAAVARFLGPGFTQGGEQRDAEGAE